MKISFKLRIALISSLVSGTLLTVFGSIFFAFVYSSAVERMDNELRSLVEPSLHRPVPREFWKTFEQSLRLIMGGKRMGQIALLVLDSQGQTIVRTANVPEQLVDLPRPERPRKTSDRSSFPFRNPPSYLMLKSGTGDLLQQPWENSRDPQPHFSPPSWDDMPRFSVAERFQTLKTEAGRWRVGLLLNPDTTVILALDMDSFYAEVDRFRNIFIAAVPLGLLLLGIAGWFLVNRAMQPVTVIVDTAEGITAKDLSRRIPPVGGDRELHQLVTVINSMLERLEKSYHQAVRFSADAAHELQTPLTILQGELDNAIQASEDGSAEQQRYGKLLEELQGLKAVVQKLLLLSRADEGRLNLHLVLFNFSQLIHEAAEDLEIIAPDIEIEIQIADDIHIPADAELLRQVVRNMISNAAKYTAQENGRVVFRLEKHKQIACFTLANTAPPIPGTERELLFHRFHRADKSRSTAGSGLGLSLALEISKAHGGNLVLNPYADGMVSFTLSLPAA